MKTIKYLAILLLILLTIQVSGQELSGIPGAFVDIGFGARPTAMGSAYTGLADDVHSVIWNPAGLSNLRKKQAAFTYTDQLGLISYHYLAAAMPLSRIDKKTIGLAIISSGDKALQEWTIQGTYSQEISDFLVGVSLKFRYASFGNNDINESDYVIFEPDEINEGIMNQVYGSASGFGIDIGAMYMLSRNITIGLMLKDIYSPVYWDSQNENPVNQPKGQYDELIPFETVFGTSVRITEEIVAAVDYAPNFTAESNARFSAGAEWKLFNIVYARGGMQYFANDVEDERYSIGTGLDLTMIKDLRVLVDFTYLFEEIDNSLRFSLGVEF
ncbi:MAG: hypothetical protein SCALA702_37230 [Melioribacteraceae bacterium]|nr:MAG: hypothetical protein SCALA702_37230 [Melioribacteraceae bacterium]